MPNSVDLTDSEGFVWDIRSNTFSGLSVEDGSSDAFDLGMGLRVNGTFVNGAFSVDENGREVNMAPQLVGGVAVSRSILVSDSTISTTGFARFLESFTNTTDETITITVETVTNSGADANLQFTATSSGDTSIDLDDTGFVVDDGNTSGFDSAVMIAYGDGTLLPTGITVAVDDITITHTLTLAPGETQSLLQFATQNAAAAQGNADLTFFASDDPLFEFDGLLTGLTDAERASVVNYSNVAAPPTAELVDADGNVWVIDNRGRLSSQDGTVVDVFSQVLLDNFPDPVSITENPDSGEVTVVTDGFAADPNILVSHTYTALPEMGVIRLVLTVDNTAGNGALNAATNPFALTYGTTATVVAQTFPPDGPLAGEVIGAVLDDSESGSGGTRDAVTVVFGATGESQSAAASGATLTVSDFLVVPPGTTASFLYFVALNDTGLQAVLDLQRLANPGPELLTGLSAEQVASFRNFELSETDRLQLISGSDGVDDTLVGNAWGDQILGASGDDDISAGGSDDAANGGDGEDQVDGGEGDDRLFGEAGNDLMTGGTGDDTIDGGLDSDLLLGQSGDDDLSGDDGTDTLIGGSGNDTLRGETGDDALSGNSGTDRLVGGIGNDTMNGGTGDDLLQGAADDDQMFGGDDRDTLNGDDGLDALFGGDDADLLFGGNDDDQLFGGQGADRMFGGAGADSLTGGAAGDTGINQLFGGKNGDTYFVTSLNDQVFEGPNGRGTDTVFSDITYTLTDNVEVLVLQGSATDGTGNALDNRLTGTAADNTLDGLGGDDTMTGGLGSDTYVVDSLSDVVVELDGISGGIDLVLSTQTHALADNVENLRLLGTGAIDGTGNFGSNIIIGNAAANALIGGSGDDTLTGGAGRDIFVFNTDLDVGDVDHLTDFRVGRDVIQLDSAVFDALPTGALNVGRFVNGTVALDARDRLIYDVATGRLRYDADGTGAEDAVIVAIIDNNAALTNASFFVI